MGRIARYLRNCFWLLVPILLLDILFAGLLPAPLQVDAFWRDIPAPIAAAETILRTLVVTLPLLMPLDLATPQRRIGVAVYAAGFMLYLGSWLLLIVAPDSAWSTGAIGFTAPAWTPLVWLLGISLVGDRLFVPALPWRWWIYAGLSAAFVAVHLLHTGIVFARMATP